AASLFDVIERFARRRWRQFGFFRMLNRMLFLAGAPDRRWQVMQRFYTLNDGLIERFYAGRPTLFDKARILSGKPPVPVREAIPAVLKQTPRLRAFKDE
ncbi:lycopene cyclase family protein, partial [Halomonas sp. 707D4]